MVVGDLDYSVQKKLETQYLRDIIQLADRIRQVEHLKEVKARLEKAIINWHPGKEKITYIKTNESNQELDVVFEYVRENKVSWHN